MVFDQDSEVPVFYRKLRGNITDVTTLDNTMHDLKGIGIGHASLVLDRGYYSEENVIHLLKRKHSFTLGTKVSLNFVKDAISEVRDGMMGYGSYDQDRRLFHASVPIEHSVPVRGRGPNVRCAYLHIYFSKEKEADDVASLMKRIAALQQQLERGKVIARRSELKKYFNLVLDANDQITGYSEHQKGVNDAIRMCGFFALLTSERHLDSSQVLSIYRKKDAVEKAFNDLKDRLSLKRTRCSRDDNFNGKVFLQFLALIITSRIRKVMKDSELLSAFTLRSLFNEVDVIEYFTYRGRAGHWGEITEKQANILMTFGVELPDEAWPKKFRKDKKPRTRRS
jgi:transposase